MLRTLFFSVVAVAALNSRPTSHPTVQHAVIFNPDEDAAALRNAMKGYGTDERAIINILTARSNAQRQTIALFFNNKFKRNLIKDLESELSGSLEKVMVALMHRPDAYLSQQLYKAMAGMGTDEQTLIEILCSRSDNEVQEIVAAYGSIYKRPLAEHLGKEISGDLARLINHVVAGVRKSGHDPSTALQQAHELYGAGEGKRGVDKNVFINILTHESFDQLNLIFDEYERFCGRTFLQAVEAELSGDLKEAIVTIVESAQDQNNYFAQRLQKAIDGKDDEMLIRVIVSRSEIDLGDIMNKYSERYKKTLQSVIKSQYKGDYKLALLALLG